MSGTIEYKCPNCGGTLSFDIHLQTLKCGHCGCELSQEEVAEYNDTINKEGNEELSFSRNFAKFTDEEANNLNVFHCEACGAEIISEGNTASTKCPYCHNNIIFKERLSGAFKPDYVIPFKHDSSEAKSLITEYLKKKLFLPKSFLDSLKIEEQKGLYCPFWLFDSTVDGKCVFKGIKKRTYTEGDYRYTETKTFKLIRKCKLKFNHVPVDGSKDLDDNISESVEPYDFADAKPFETSYLSGHLADKYDVDQSVCLNRAKERFQGTTIGYLEDTTGKYEEVSLESSSFNYSNQRVNYALYPLWLFTYTYRKKKYEFAMNGETGKIVSNLPCSIGKYAMWFAIFYFGATATIFLLVCLLGGFDKVKENWLTPLFCSVVLGFIAPAVFCHINRKKLKDVHKKYAAYNYVQDNSYNLYHSKDILVHTSKSKERIKKN